MRREKNGMRQRDRSCAAFLPSVKQGSESRGNSPAQAAGIPGMGAKSLKHQCLPWENRVGCHSEETRRIKPALTCVFLPAHASASQALSFLAHHMSFRYPKTPLPSTPAFLSHIRHTETLILPYGSASVPCLHPSEQSPSPG